MHSVSHVSLMSCHSANSSMPTEPSKQCAHVDFQRLTACSVSVAELKECPSQQRYNQGQGVSTDWKKQAKLP